MNKNLKQWKPGQSGNPGGRPRISADFREACKEFMDAAGFNRLQEIADDIKHKDNFRALQLIINYSYGRPEKEDRTWDI